MITLDEAIEELSIDLGEWTIPFTLNQREALKLGKEALKLEKWRRGNMPSPLYVLLPGETKESNSPGLPLGG